MVSFDTEVEEQIKVIKTNTPPKRKPVPAPRRSVTQRVTAPIDQYIPMPLKDLQREKLIKEIACKPSQRKELCKITAAMDLEIMDMNRQLTHLENSPE